MKFKYFKESALDEHAALGLTREEYRKQLMHLENNPPPTRRAFTRVGRVERLHTSDGYKHHVSPTLVFSGTPELDVSEGHAHDASWEYPLLEKRYPGAQQLSAQVSQAEFVRLRKNLKKKIPPARVPATSARAATRR